MVVELPALAVADLAHQLVLAQVAARAHRVHLPPLVRLLVLLRALPPVLALVLDGLPVLAHLVVEPEGPLQRLLSRQLFSAARVRSSR